MVAEGGAGGDGGVEEGYGKGESEEGDEEDEPESVASSIRVLLCVDGGVEKYELGVACVLHNIVLERDRERKD